MKYFNTQSGKSMIWLLILIVIIVLIAIFAGKKSSAGEYTVMINNVSETQPLSPGVFAVHTKEASLDFEKQISPTELEPLAEFGSHANFAAYVSELEGVEQIISIDEPILPGQSSSFSFTAPDGQYYLSGIQMAVATNDGYVLLDAAPLHPKKEMAHMTINHDNGTEENSELGSGFAGGQPDPTQGELNIANGEETEPQEKVSKHPQLINQLMEVVITPVQ